MMKMNKISLLLCALFSVNSAWAEHELKLREVNVSAPQEAQLLLNQMEAERSVTPGAVTVVDGESLQERNVGNLSDMLRYVPGVWANSYNGNDDVFYSSRGSNLDATDYDKNGVKFFQDGLPVTAADGNNHNRAIDALNARAIVVAHGANALAYGASTLGGAMDFITPTARTSSPFSLSLSGGSFGEQRVRATAGGVSGALDGQFSVQAMKRDGYRDHSHQDRQSLYANVGVQMTEDVSTRFYATYDDLYLELPRELTWAQYHANPRQATAAAVAGNHSKAVEAWRLAFKTTVNNVAGGTALNAMHGVVVESGLRGTSVADKAKWNWDVTAYYTALRNEILSVEGSVAGTSFATNIDKTTHAGVEALVGASFDISGGHRIEPLINATFNAFSFDSDPTYGNNRLPAAPRWFARGEVMYANTSGFRIGPTFDFVGARYIDFANTQRVGSYGLFGARAEYETGQWNVFAEARNLADKDYVGGVVVKTRAGASDALLHPGAPRSIYVGARYQF